MVDSRRGTQVPRVSLGGSQPQNRVSATPRLAETGVGQRGHRNRTYGVTVLRGVGGSSSITGEGTLLDECSVKRQSGVGLTGSRRTLRTAWTIG